MIKYQKELEKIIDETLSPLVTLNLRLPRWKREKINDKIKKHIQNLESVPDTFRLNDPIPNSFSELHQKEDNTAQSVLRVTFTEKDCESFLEQTDRFKSYLVHMFNTFINESVASPAHTLNRGLFISYHLPGSDRMILRQSMSGYLELRLYLALTE